MNLSDGTSRTETPGILAVVEGCFFDEVGWWSEVEGMVVSDQI